MVDTFRRKKLALHLRHLCVGVISNDEFEEGIMDDVTSGWLPEQYYRAKQAEFDDAIIIPMLELCWGLYDDTRRHKLIGNDELSKEALNSIKRCILFLHSDLEYEWPSFDSINPLVRFSLLDLLVAILTLGQNYREKRKEQEQAFLEFTKAGDYNLWPFFRKSDYDKQLIFPPFMNTKRKL